jgi:hypothetical protein
MDTGSGGGERVYTDMDWWSKIRLEVLGRERSKRESLRREGIKILNVAGPRASKDPAIYDATRGLLKAVLVRDFPRPSKGRKTGSSPRCR